MRNKVIFKPDNPDIIHAKILINNKKELFEFISEQIASHTNLSAAGIFARLTQKEKEQPSSIGNGVALPHAKILHLKKTTSILITLDKSIDFEAADRKPVNTVYTLLSPRRDQTVHLQRLAAASRMFKNKDLVDILHNAQDSETLQGLIHLPKDWTLAA